jgi:hypothetical protein
MTNQFNFLKKDADLTPDINDVPLRQALAFFLSEDIDDSFRQITNITNGTYRKYKKLSETKFIVLFLALLGFTLSFFAFLAIAPHVSKASSIENTLFGIAFLSLIAVVCPFIIWQLFQYGWKELEEPIKLPHEANARVDEFLSILQKESSARAYYYSVLTKKRVHLERRLFFGRLRYLLFSEHAPIRRLVTRYRFFYPAPADIFMRRADVERILADSKPKRKPGPGREPKYPYTDAVIGLIGNPELGKLSSDDQSSAVRKIESLLKEWFEANVTESGEVPRSDLIRPYAKKVYDRLAFLALHKSR